MAREWFESRRLTGMVNVACKFDDGSVRYWSDRKEVIVENIVAIVNEYSAKGYTLTLRQLHYQLVSRNWIVNHDTAYKKLGNILDDCRYSGIINWDAIEDRGRVPHLLYYVDGIKDALEDTVKYYRLNRQLGQSNCIELWTEKDALSGILKRTTEKYHINLVVNKGYTSSSAMHRSYQRCINALLNNQKFTIMYFGDHDPSGLDMIRDIEDRMMFFICRGARLTENKDFREKIDNWWDENQYTLYTLIENYYCDPEIEKLIHGDHSDLLMEKLGDDFATGRIKMFVREHSLVDVIPIGLTMTQIKTHKLPPNPTKLTDSRAEKYIKQFGKTCWEVDALSPEVLTQIVETNIEKNIDLKLFEKMLKKEKSDKDKLNSFIKK
jgi:hypothetical protein